jgi:hypothetical protein
MSKVYEVKLDGFFHGGPSTLGFFAREDTALEFAKTFMYEQLMKTGLSWKPVGEEFWGKFGHPSFVEVLSERTNWRSLWINEHDLL